MPQSNKSKRPTTARRKAKPKTAIATKQSKKKQQLERKQLYEVQQNVLIRRFPTRLSDREEIERLKVWVAQALAVMDRFLEFWELSVCPFQKEHGQLSKHELEALADARKKQQPDTTWLRGDITLHLCSFLRLIDRNQ